MSEQTDREDAAATLTALNRYHTVYDHAIRSLDGISPVAAVMLSGFVADGATRGGGPTLHTYEYSVGIYVIAEIGAEAAAEDSLGSLMADSALALAGDGWRIVTANARPGGAGLRLIDGRPYRVGELIISR